MAPGTRTLRSGFEARAAAPWGPLFKRMVPVMDIAPQFSGTASGIVNTGSALAAIISPVVGGFLIDRTGNWQLPFLGSMVLMLAGAALTSAMRPGRRLLVQGA